MAENNLCQLTREVQRQTFTALECPQEITAALRSFDPEGMKTEEIVRQCLRAMVMR